MLEPVRYRLEVGDSQTQAYTIGVRQKPTVSEVQVTLRYPAYLDRPSETATYRQADLEAPQYTVAELRIRPATPIARGHVLCEGKQFHGTLEQDGQGGWLLAVKLPLLRDAAFTIHLFNDAGHTDAAPRQNRIHVLPDNPPTVEVVKPLRESTAKPDAEVPVEIRATDDHGLSRVRLEMKVSQGEAAASDDDAAPVTVEEWTGLKLKSADVLQHRLKLPADRFSPGQKVAIRAVAWDARNFEGYGLDLMPQETGGAWHTIRIVGAEVAAAEEAARLDHLRADIWKILDRQIRARVRASVIVTMQEPGEAARASGDVRGRQIEIQKSAVAVVGSIGDDAQADHQKIKRTVHRLALGEMLEAVRLCDELVKVASLDGFAQPVADLKATQDRIIEVLRGLLDAVRQAEAKALAEIQQRPGGDLPADVEKKLKAARDKLAEFVAEQKKVIEASENLAKKPVEDFTEEDKALLEKLTATESDWSRFMKELNTDLSKLPEQDFSNPSMLEELIGIETELKMAEDALTKKTVDIAVPLEQLGAEMAEEIQTNLEKWLPDTPDRERWSQGGIAHRRRQGGPDGRTAGRVGRPCRRTDGRGGRPL